jgi:precorrin-6A/cobalt-precorrin-6A reductase
MIVCKNSGGTGAAAKLAAARALALPVLMIDRPPLPDRTEFHRPQDVMDWIGHGATPGSERGV